MDKDKKEALKEESGAVGLMEVVEDSKDIGDDGNGGYVDREWASLIFTMHEKELVDIAVDRQSDDCCLRVYVPTSSKTIQSNIAQLIDNLIVSSRNRIGVMSDRSYKYRSRNIITLNYCWVTQSSK